MSGDRGMSTVKLQGKPSTHQEIFLAMILIQQNVHYLLVILAKNDQFNYLKLSYLFGRYQVKFMNDNFRLTYVTVKARTQRISHLS